MWDPDIQGVRRATKGGEDDQFKWEAWELLDEESEDEAGGNSKEKDGEEHEKQVDAVPPPQRSVEDMALGGQGANDSLNSLSKARARGTSRKVTRNELSGQRTSSNRSCGESTRARVDALLVDYKQKCESLGLEYDEESIQSTESVYNSM